MIKLHVHSQPKVCFGQNFNISRYNKNRKKLLVFKIHSYADYEFAFILLILKMADPIWRKKNENYSMLIKIVM